MHWHGVTKLARYFFIIPRKVYFMVLNDQYTQWLTYKNIRNMVNKIFNVPNHPKLLN